ncbi:MAG: hypothetical protein WCC60_04095 [Ilumatobacteraceae bacterium]
MAITPEIDTRTTSPAGIATPDDAMATPTTLVLLDPTSADGESALELLDGDDDHVTLLVLLSGPASRALRDFANAEEIDMSTAGWQYLDQVAPRVSLAPHQLVAMTASGPSAAAELADIAATEPVRRVLLPSSVDRFEPGLAGLLGGCINAPVETAPLYADVA